MDALKNEFRLINPEEAKLQFGGILGPVTFLDDSDWGMLSAINGFNAETMEHSVNTCLLAKRQAEQLHRLPNGKQVNFRESMESSGISYEQFLRAALLHDIGKITVPKEILFKPGRLDNNERKIVSAHENSSQELLISSGRRVEGLIAGQHHNYDHREMECKFHIAEIDIMVPVADILHLADVQDALLAKRVYKPCLSPFKAFHIIIEQVMKGEINMELAFLWIAEETKRYFVKLATSAKMLWDEIKNFIAVFSFLVNQYGKLRHQLA